MITHKGNIKATATLVNTTECWLVVGDTSTIISAHTTQAAAERAISHYDDDTINDSRYGFVEIVAPGQTVTGEYVLSVVVEDGEPYPIPAGLFADE